MKLSLPSPKPLLDALEAASLAISGARTLPALSCCLIECRAGGGIRATSDSMEARVSIAFDGADIDEPFAFLVAPRLLRSALRGSEASTIFKDGRLTIQSGGETKLLTLPVTEFPKEWQDIECQPVDSARFLSALRMTVHCADSSIGSPRHGIFWEPDSTYMVGGCATGLVAVPLDLGFDAPFVLPSSQAKLITSCFEVGDDMRVGMDNNILHVQQGNRWAWIKLWEGKMPPLSKMLPKEPVFASVNREALVGALEAMADFCDPEFGRVCLDFVQQTLSCASITGASTIPLPMELMAQNQGPLTFSRQAMLKAIRFWTCDTLSFTTNGSCLMLTPDDSSTSLAVCNLIRPL